MRTLRLGDTASSVGNDLRAALASWGRGDGVAGGVALIGYRPPDHPEPLEAVILLPRAVLVVVGVDLPDPAMRLEAPLSGVWKTDGWPLTRQDGPVNPAVDALGATSAVSDALESARAEPLPTGTVVAVGPYVGQVAQPSADLVRGVRILHPEPKSLLTAARELSTHTRVCPATDARRMLTALGVELDHADLVAEGFGDVVAPAVAAASTTFIPKIALEANRPEPAQARQRSLRWLPIAAVLLVAVLLITGIAVAISSADEDPGGGQAPHSSGSAVPVEGIGYTARGTAEATDCAAHAFGDVQAWLQANRCARLIRARFEAADRDGRQAAVLVSVLRFAGSTSGAELRAVADRPGAGGVRDQAAEGVPWPGDRQPAFTSAAYASGREGNSVKLVQAVWLDQASTPEDPALREIATRALRLGTGT
ncbi:hypothetical protein UO65_3300 [Actinokineospora spheciospongiae]|uniref:Uncharacterized protein n=1 Tax=Actinokineospora spheciospongiae TaxID=909613 RepID=W7IX89_9PSEU|nr:hypothetical protein [Actinokineospora spheciospongiae]EWC61447.1 hypothetical protein UO65_3300 [Actinokineospora spheciospongiae]